MKKKWLLCIVLCIMMVIVGGCMLLNYENRKTYTYEELSSLPANQLLDLFIENGLVINEELKEAFTEEKLQDLFKLEFDTLHIGITTRSHLMYFDLAEKTKEIYDKITE
ncbi:MAG: hypothetical protein RR398_05455 [Clostridia bacterium]